MRCGFIGLGHIGKFLAGSLLRKGFEVTVYDLNADAAAPRSQRCKVGWLDHRVVRRI